VIRGIRRLTKLFAVVRVVFAEVIKFSDPSIILLVEVKDCFSLRISAWVDGEDP
jgi:hypothetical protein